MAKEDEKRGLLVAKLSTKSGQDEDKVLRQSELIKRLQTSDTQYEYITKRFTAKKLEKIIKSLDAYKYGLNAAAPIICMGPLKCPFFHACPIGEGLQIDAETGKKHPIYDDLDDFPIGDQCIAEKVFIEQRLIDYVQEFDIDPDRPSELSLINDLALVDLHKQRCVLYLAAGDKDSEGTDFMKVDLMFDSQSGAEIGRSYKEHPVVAIIDRLEKRRHKILDELIATRKGKADMSAKFNTTGEASRLQEEIIRIREHIQRKELEHKVLIEAGGPSLVLNDEEDYIKLD